MPRKAGIVTSREVSLSSRKRKMTICEKSSEMTLRALNPARLLLSFQNSMSDLKAKNSKSKCRSEATIVTASRYMDVSAI
jgi:hypothetical protein